jgi:lipopolysaccharide exporter
VTRSYVEVASLIWMISLPMCAGTIAVANEVVAVLLGPRWEDAATVVRLLALGTVFGVMTANTHYVYWAVGHSRAVAAISAVGAAIVVPVTVVCSHLAGYTGVALAYALTSAALVPINFAMLRRLAGVGFMDLWVYVWRVTLAAMAMLAILLAALPHPSHEAASAAALVLLLKIVVGAATYVATVAALWLAGGKPDGPERRTLQLAIQWTHRRMKRYARNSEGP